jgi:hypothetical protein
MESVGDEWRHKVSHGNHSSTPGVHP